jgi:hypothetical protein
MSMWHKNSITTEIPFVDNDHFDKTGTELLPYLKQRLAWLLELGEKLAREGWVIDFTIGGMVVDHPSSWSIEDPIERMEYVNRKLDEAGIPDDQAYFPASAKLRDICTAQERYQKMVDEYADDPPLAADSDPKEAFEMGRTYGRYEGIEYALNGSWLTDPERDGISC